MVFLYIDFVHSFLCRVCFFLCKIYYLLNKVCFIVFFILGKGIYCSGHFKSQLPVWGLIDVSLSINRDFENHPILKITQF